MRIRIQNPIPQSSEIKRHSLPTFFFRDRNNQPEPSINNSNQLDSNSKDSLNSEQIPHESQSLNSTSQSTQFIVEIKEFLQQEPYNDTEFLPFDYFSKEDSSTGFLDNESNLGRVISDLELPVEEKLRVLTIPESARALFCQHVIEEDETIPHPKYLLDCIRKKPHERLFIELDNNINRNRKSYRQIFIDDNGFELLMKYLLLYLNGTSEERQSTTPYLTHVLRCIENIINSQLFGPNIFEDDMMILLIKSTIQLMNTDIPDDDFTTCLSIITGSLLQSYQELNIERVDLTINMLDKSPQSFWIRMINVIKMNHKHFNVVLASFANRMLLENYHGLMECKIVLLFARERFMDNLRDMNNDLFSQALQRYDEDYEFLVKISPNVDINPFSIDSIIHSYEKNMDENKILYSISLSLFEMLSNRDILTFICNFLTLCRCSVCKNEKIDLKLIALSALINNSPIVIPYKGKNPCTLNLNSKYCYALKEDIENVDIEQYSKLVKCNETDTQVQIELDTEKTKNNLELDVDQHNELNELIETNGQIEFDVELEIDQNSELNELIYPKNLNQLNLQLDQNIEFNEIINSNHDIECNENAKKDSSIQTDKELMRSDLNSIDQMESNAVVDKKIKLISDHSLNSFERKSCTAIKDDSDLIAQLRKQISWLIEHNQKLKNAAHVSNAIRFEQEAILAQLKKDKSNLDGYRIENEKLKLQLKEAELQIQQLKQLIESQ